jgi:hypothetical protein
MSRCQLADRATLQQMRLDQIPRPLHRKTPSRWCLPCPDTCVADVVEPHTALSVFAGREVVVRDRINGDCTWLERCCTGCYTDWVPTRHPRHSITETPPVREALDSLRRRGERIKLDDLVIRGARDRLRELEVGRGEEAEKAELRRELIEQLRTGDGLDVDAAYEVSEHGWTH